MGVNWTEEQRCAITNRGGTLLVSAAAGSGKTAVLVQRVLGRVTDMENPCDIDSFLIVTFTKAAASEMRGKISDALAQRAAGQPDNAHLRRQLMLVHRAHITTVHAFCMSLLREHFYELGLPPDFRTADENEQLAIKQEVLEDVLEAQYAGQSEEFAALVDMLSGGRDDRQLNDIVLELFDKLQASPAPARVLDGFRAQLTQPFDRLADTAFGRELLETARDRIEYGIASLRGALDEMESAPEVREKYAPAFLDDLQRAQALLALVQDGAWDAAVQLCAEICKSRVRLAAIRGYEDKAFLEQLKAARAVWKEISDTLAEQVLCMYERDVRADRAMMAPASCALCDTVRAFMDAYQQEKLRRGVVDFNDLEHYAVQLLTDADGAPTPLAREMHFTEVMVDEYQDTNAVQDTIFRAVSDDEKNIFMVGDVKQSIYRFRLADPAIFLQKNLAYGDAACVFTDAPRRVVLSQNFRSRPEVLDSVNYLFSALMRERLGDLDYTEREALHTGAQFPKGTDDYRTEFCVLETDADDEEAPESIRQEAKYCAARVRRMLDDGFRVTDGRSGALRPCRPEDFAILLRSAKDKAGLFQKELAALGIPSATQEADDMLDTPELLTLVSWLEMIDNPRQDVPLIAAMTSPLAGFTEDELGRIRLADPEGDFYAAVCAAAPEMPKVQAFLQQLEELRLLAADLPVRQLLWHIVDRTGALGIFAAMPGGRARQRNITSLIELAGSFERGGSRGLFAFVRQLREMRASGRPWSAPEREQAAGLVRIMTIHKSKGLEFPIVIVANCAKRFNERDLSKPVLLHEKLGISMRCRDTARGIQYDSLDRHAMLSVMRHEMVSEELRVLYVALTRAKEKLICICALRRPDSQAKKWAAIAALDPIPTYALAGANSYAMWLAVPLLRHPGAAPLRALCTQLPELDFDAPDCFCVRVERYQPVSVHETDAYGQVMDTPICPAPTLRDYAADALRDLPSKLTATAVPQSFRAQETQEDTVPPKHEAQLRRPFFDRAARGLTPSEIGTAHHLFLQFCDFARCEQADGRQAELERLREMHILSAEQADCIKLTQIAAFFSSELYRLLGKAERVHREFKFSVLVPAEEYYPEAADFPQEQVLLQGVMDCLLELPDGLIIIDFKTDRVYGGGVYARAEQYRAQLAAYRRAARLIFDKPVKSCALFFLSCGKTVWMP